MRELEAELEEERKQRGQALGGKKKLEGELKDMEDQLEATSRGRDEAIKQLRKIQVSTHTVSIRARFIQRPAETRTEPSLLSLQGQVKELQRELEDSRTAHKEVMASARESERKSKAMEADIIQLHEVASAGTLHSESAVKHKRESGSYSLNVILMSMSSVLLCVRASRCWQQLSAHASRRTPRETSCQRNWPATPLESGCLALTTFTLLMSTQEAG